MSCWTESPLLVGITRISVGITDKVSARNPKVLPLITNSHSFAQSLTNQKLRRASSLILTGLKLHEKIFII